MTDYKAFTENTQKSKYKLLRNSKSLKQLLHFYNVPEFNSAKLRFQINFYSSLKMFEWSNGLILKKMTLISNMYS